MLQVRSSHCFWCLPPVAKVGSVGSVGFLVEGTGACVLVDEAGSCLSGGQDHTRGCVLGCLWTYYDFKQPLRYWVGLCSCLASCLAWYVQHWSLLVIEWSWVLALRWRSLGERSLIDITWCQEASGGPVSWTRLSHLRGSGLTPGRSTKTLSATVQSGYGVYCRADSNSSLPIDQQWVFLPMWDLSSQSTETPRFAAKRGFTHKAVQQGAGEQISNPPSSFPEGRGLRVPLCEVFIKVVG